MKGFLNVSSSCLFARLRLITIERNLPVSTQSRSDFIELMWSTVKWMPASGSSLSVLESKSRDAQLKRDPESIKSTTAGLQYFVYPSSLGLRVRKKKRRRTPIRHLTHQGVHRALMRQACGTSSCLPVVHNFLRPPPLHTMECETLSSKDDFASRSSFRTLCGAKLVTLRFEPTNPANTTEW